MIKKRKTEKFPNPYILFLVGLAGKSLKPKVIKIKEP
jgi:hypothetical protein